MFRTRFMNKNTFYNSHDIKLLYKHSDISMDSYRNTFWQIDKVKVLPRPVIITWEVTHTRNISSFTRDFKSSALR